MDGVASDFWLFGATSIIGWNIARSRPAATCFCNPYARIPMANWRRIKLEDDNTLRHLFDVASPSTLVHCGGVCDVPACENNPDWGWQINVRAVELLLRYLPSTVRLIYVSSDHVFGDRTMPCDEETPVAPISRYARGRVAAETMIAARDNSLILRAGLPIGPSPSGRTGHLDWLRSRHQAQRPMTVIRDEYRSAVWASHLAHRILMFADSAICGIRHIAATQAVSRPTLATRLGRLMGFTPSLTIASRSEQPYPHIGRLELSSRFDDAIATPLPSPIDTPLPIEYTLPSAHVPLYRQ